MLRSYKLKSNAFLFILVVFSIVKFLTIDQIATRPLNDYDEARYAEVSKNMLLTGEILVPLAGGPDEPRNIPFTKLNNGQELYPFFWKPPLVIWLQALSMKIVGINEFAVRLPSFIASLGILILLSLILRHYKVRDKIAFPLLFAFILSYDFSFISTQGTTDALLSCFGLLTIWHAHINKKHSIMIASISTGLALLTKSIAAFWVPIMFIYISINLKGLSIKNTSKYLFWITVVAAPWFIFMYLRFGNVFIERHFFFNANGGAVGGQNFAPLQWYVIYMLDMWKPLIFLAPIMVHAMLQDLNEKKWNYIIPLMWIGIILIPFSFSKAKVWWYIYPMWSAFILLAALSIQGIQRNTKQLFLTIGLVSLSLIPYWQLTINHIPLKTFLLVVIVATALMIGLKNNGKKKINANMITLLMLLIMSTSIYHWYVSYPKNPTQNTAIKKLALRNQGLTRISILGMPYESALYYFNTGNVITDIGHYDKEQYILHNNTSAPLDLKNFKLIDKEGDLFLYKHNE